jgi:hypothetical protein
VIGWTKDSTSSSSLDSSSIDEDVCNGGYEMMNEKKRRDKYSIVSNRIESNRIESITYLA